MKNEQLNILKNNNEKIIELNEKKFRYYENEIYILKEKIGQLLNISKSTTLNESKRNKNSLNIRNKEGNELINNSLAKLMTAVNDHIKEQNNDNKNLINKLMEEKEIEFINDKKLFHKLSKIKNNNNDLENKLQKTNYIIKKIQEQIKDLLPYKDLINNLSNFKCKKCNKYFTLNEYKLHQENCPSSNPLNNQKNSKINFNTKINPDKLKILILKGKIKNNSSNSPYLEYILDVNYGNNQHWRLGKKFKDFTNLYNLLNTEYKEFIKIPISNIFIDIKNSTNVGSFHENKIRQLELFMNEIINMDMINKSQAFSKFIEFDKYCDEENEIITHVNTKLKNDSKNKNINENNFNETPTKIIRYNNLDIDDKLDE
jgi:hypothetical protein